MEATSNKKIPLEILRYLRGYEEELRRLVYVHIEQMIDLKGEHLTIDDVHECIGGGYTDYLEIKKTRTPPPDADTARRAMEDFEAGRWSTPKEILHELSSSDT